MIAPLGEQYLTGSRPVGLAISSSGRSVVTADYGPRIPSLTLVESHPKAREERQIPAVLPGPETREDAWRSVSRGLAFSGEHAVFLSEGASGRVAQIDLESGDRRRAFDLNQEGYAHSFAGDLVLDSPRSVFYVADTANSRIAVIDARTKRILASVPSGQAPFALALSPDRRKLYVTNLGDAQADAVPSVKVVDVSNPSAPKVEASVRIGSAQASDSLSPTGIFATDTSVYVSNPANDSIRVIDAATNSVRDEIPLRIPGLEALRGVLPAGLAYQEKSGWLLVAEAGINAVGVIDTRSGKVLGQIPAGWFPTRVAIDHDSVYVANLRGRGSGPGISMRRNLAGFVEDDATEGSLSIYKLPSAADLPEYTATVMKANGFETHPEYDSPLPSSIRHVVLIVKSGRGYDEVLGDVSHAANGAVMGQPLLARFGLHGFADGGKQRLSLHDVDLTPNQHAISRRWAFSDNFYAEAESESEGLLTMMSSYPDRWMASWFTAALHSNRTSGWSGSPDRAGSVWRHLSESRITWRVFADGSKGSDTARVSNWIREMDHDFAGADLPRLLVFYVPNDRAAAPRPEQGFPYEESFVLDNDAAIGRLLAYFSKSKWWREMTVFITADSAAHGFDHLDSHRTLLVAAGPWVKKNYACHANTSYPGLLKTIFALLHVPPMAISDATAGDLSACFTTTLDTSPYQPATVDTRIFDPRGE